MKLIAIAVTESPRGIRPALTYVEIGKPGPFADWKFEAKGGSVFAVSPPGWRPGQSVTVSSDGPSRIFEIPRSRCELQWEGDAAEVAATGPVGIEVVHTRAKKSPTAEAKA